MTQSRPAPHDGAPKPPLAYFVDLEPPQGDFLNDVLAGLSASPKTLSPKYFYDKRGSELFDAICAAPEYYVTRTEQALLKTIIGEVSALTGPGAVIVEYGSGSSWKIRTLIEGLERPAEYLAQDISRDHLIEAAEAIAAGYPDLRVGAVCADFMQTFDLPDDITPTPPGRRLGFFPGSTIGNLTRPEAAAMLTRIAKQLGDGAGFLVGVDLLKDTDVLTAAYDDAGGATAAFNLNLLHRMKAELGADLDVEGFRHRARFNEAEERIEMHLEAIGAQTIRLAGQSFAFADGESIHTENSHKYTIKGFQALARQAGFTPAAVWTDPDELFSLHYLDVSLSPEKKGRA